MVIQPFFAQIDPLFAPSMNVIVAITNANPAVVTTSRAQNGTPSANGYVSGLNVRLDIPPGYGMQQANQMTGYITVLTNSTFSININTTSFDAFVIPLTGTIARGQQACVVPIGEQISQLSGAVHNTSPVTSDSPPQTPTF